MSNPNGAGWSSQPAPVYAQRQPLPYAALAGVRTRRIVAVCFDLFIVAVICTALWLVLGLLSFGILWFVLPPMFPFIAFFYNGLTISGWRMATPGMKMMDLEARLTDGSRVPFINAAVSAVLFYVSWMFPPVFLISLFADEKRCLHDILSGIVITRRA
jgi:uncharacterized RDD family membrane protein YckC